MVVTVLSTKGIRIRQPCFRMFVIRRQRPALKARRFVGHLHFFLV